MKTKIAGKKAEQNAPEKPLEKKRLFGNWTGKLPVNLLYEHCQREHFEKPQFHLSKKFNGYQCSIIISKINKKSGETETIRHSSNDVFESEQLAKHSAATYSLHRLCSGKNMHTLLPPEQRELWFKYDKLKSECDPDLLLLNYSADPFLARTQQAQESDKPVAPKQDPWDAYPQLFIPRDLREKLEDLTRSNIDHLVVNNARDGSELDKNSLAKVLVGKGFRKAHVEESLLYCTDLKSAMDWLCIHCPEDDLPEEMRPTDLKSIMFQKVDPETLSSSLLLQRTMRSGFSRMKCKEHLELNNNDEYLAITTMCLQLAGLSLDPAPEFEQEEMLSILMEEKEVLDSIYPDSYTFKETEYGTVFTFSLECTGPVELCISKNLKYPYQMPGIVIEGGVLPSYLRLAILKKVVSESKALFGSPMLYSIISFIEEHTPTIVQNPPPLLSLYQNSEALEFGSPDASQAIAKISRDKKPAKDLDDGVLMEYQQLIKQPAYNEMLTIRKKLPSYGYKEKICDVVTVNRSI
jgi:ATP-dependent RNA helicase DHX57